MQRAFSILALLLLMLLVATADAASGRQKVGDSTISYDDADFRWDKKAFDTPPTAVGGQAALICWLEYPTALRRQRIEGRAIVSVTIGNSGAVTTVSFSPRMHRDLESLVTHAVRKCRWSPGHKQGKPVAGNISFPVTFTLTKP